VEQKRMFRRKGCFVVGERTRKNVDSIKSERHDRGDPSRVGVLAASLAMEYSAGPLRGRCPRFKNHCCVLCVGAECSFLAMRCLCFVCVDCGLMI